MVMDSKAQIEQGDLSEMDLTHHCLLDGRRLAFAAGNQHERQDAMHVRLRERESESESERERERERHTQTHTHTVCKCGSG